MRAIKTADLTPNSLKSESEKLWVYNALDCCVTLEVLGCLETQLDNQTRSTYEFEKSLQGPVIEMNMRGILIDKDERDKSVSFYETQLRQLEGQLNRIISEGIGVDLNWRSPKQLMKLFYEIMGFPPIYKKKKDGSKSITVDRDALEKLEDHFYLGPIIRHLLVMRDVAKKISTLKTSIDTDGRARTSINIAGTETGRFSSAMSDFGSGGNLQNIEEQLRRPFIADPGMKMAYIDLEQAESRVVGAIEWNLFHDGRYLDACESGDLHSSVVKMMYPGMPWTGDLSKDKEIAEAPFYRHHSYRHMCKVLGHGCLTEDHEVLTRDGWVPINSMPSEIMAWKEDASFFSDVQKWTDFNFTGELCSFEGASISLLTTPEHRIPYKSDQRAKTKIKERRADSGPGLLMPLGDNYIGGSRQVPARLIAAFMADGSQSDYGMTFHFRKQRKIDRLRELCEQYFYRFTEYFNTDGSSKIVVKGELPKNPGPFMLDWSKSCIEDFIDELVFWDGHKSETASCIFSSKKENLEWYQTLARLVGVGGNIQKPQTSGFGTTMYRLQQNNRKWANGGSINFTRIAAVSRRVLCPTVKTSWFYARRNGKIFITGNSNYDGKPWTMAKHTKMDQKIIKEFQEVYFAAFAHKQWHQWVRERVMEDGYLVSLTGRRRWFFGRRSEDSTIREAIAFDPQGSVGDILNTGMLQVWRLHVCQLLLQVHDAILIQYPENQEDQIIPKITTAIKVSIQLNHGRTLIIPCDVKTGWNWSNYSKDNTDGLKKFKGHDDRVRSTKKSILDRLYQ